MKKRLEVMPVQCKTCPFRDEGWASVRGLLEKRALTEATPICHSTGSTALVSASKKTNSRQKLCRGARDFQLTIFYRLGVIEAPTDEAWDKRARTI